MRRALKGVANAMAVIAVSPMVVSFWIRSRMVGSSTAMMASSQLLALVPGLMGQYLRRAFYRRALAECHPTSVIEFGTILSQTGASLGENVYVGPGCHLGWVHLGRDVLIAAGVHIPSGPDTHGTEDLQTPIREQPGRLRQVTIGEGSWIGSGSIVLADVGAEVVVAAGSVVTKPVRDRVVVAGVPARVVRERGRQGTGSLTSSDEAAP